MSKKSIVTSLLLAALAAGVSTAATDRRDFKDLAARTAIADEAAKPGSKCPLSRAYIDTLDLDVLSICVSYGLTAMEAAQRYPALATRVFALYGDDPMFRSVFDRYGHQVIPVVGYFIENGSTSYRVNATVQGAFQQISLGQMPAWGEKLTSEQIGFMAVQELDERGAELLAEFEIVDGHAKRKLIEASVLGAKNFFLGGIHRIETVWVRGGSPTWREYGGAALDVAVVAGGIGLLAKEARAAEVVAARSSPRVIAVNASRTLRNVGTVAIGPVGNLAVLYVALTHPMLIASAVGWGAEQLGLNGPVCIFFAYLLLFRMVYWFFRPLFWCVCQPIRLAIRAFPRRQLTSGAMPS
jgi:hypothetical protein